MRLSGRCLLGACVLALAGGLVAHAQTVPPPPTPAPVAAEQPTDPFGRSTPRGTVLGLLSAARKGDDVLARQYLNTRLTDRAAEDLAHQLFVVLDARLTARLTQLSDAPEGSRADPLSPDQERIGTITGDAGEVPIVVERVKGGKAGSIWLFSSKTLDAIPAMYTEVVRSRADAVVPSVLFDKRVLGVRLLDWLAILLGLPALYGATVLLNRALTPPARAV